MGDISLKLISIGLLVAIIWIVGILYWTQKKDNSLYNEVTKLITNDNVKKMVDILTVLTLIMLAILLIALELSIFFPSVEWGWLDRNTLITTFATIIGGFFGFIGASIGIIGTYGAFYLGVNKEKHQRISTSYQVMYYMLNNSVQKTYPIVSNIIERYYELNKHMESVLLKNDNIILTGDIEKDLKYLSENKFEGDFNKEKYLISNPFNSPAKDKRMTLVQWNLYKNFKEDIKQEFENIDFSSLIYDDDWYKYIIDLPEAYIGEITEWINILKFNKFDDFFDFIHYRNIIISDVKSIYDTDYVRKQSVSTLASDIAHNYKIIYKRILNDDK